MVVQVDKLGLASAGVSIAVGSLAGSDQIAALAAPVIDVNAAPGTVDTLVPPTPVFTSGLASNYSISKSNGYLIVLPSQSAALSSTGASGSAAAQDNVFYLQLNQTELTSASQALEQLRPVLAPVALTSTTPDVPPPQPGPQIHLPSGGESSHQATEYLRDIQESTPAVIDKLRARPLLMWDAKPSQAWFDLSDSGVTP